MRSGNLIQAGRVVLAGMLALALATGCRSHRGEEAKSTPEILYKRAHDSLDNQSFEEAIKTLEALQSRFPFSDPARQARLDLIYAYYKTHATEQAVDAADTFVRENPASPRVDYAMYMKGLVYFERQPNFIERYFNVDLSERAPVDSAKSFEAFNALIKRYPHSEYVNDARQRMIYLRNRLAAYELRVAQYYMRRGAYVGAMNRAKYAVENYDGATAIEPCLAILIQAYRALKMEDLAANAEKVYKENFPADMRAIRRKKHWWNIF
ncbi:MAG: outer membrane protein assembly factor BamD [Steroidobacteraceae bacterium]